MNFRAHLQRLIHPLIEYRILLSFGLSAACGIVLNSLYPVNNANPLLRLVAWERPPIFHGLVWSYDLFLYSTPFLILSMLFSLAYVHIYRRESEQAAGALPPYSDPRSRQDLSLVVGELHRQLVPKPSPAPQWLTIPERGLYTGTCIVGATGSGKTAALVLPAMRQLFAYRASDPERKLSGVVLEVKGDLCRQLRRILKWCGREQDYVEVSLDGEIRYNPLNNSLDPYAQAFNIASIITSIWGKGKEPFWQQSYTDLVRYVILLHRVRDGYLTLVDLFRTVISAGRLEEMLIEVGSRFSRTQYIGIGKTTLANVLADFIPENDRILILEDVAELHIRKPHVISAEAQLDTHKSQIGFADLLKAALRHRPDRIIVGEIRGPEARVFLDALNTGHRGSLTTIHANSAEDALRRLAQLAMRGSGGVSLHDVEGECRRSIGVVAHVANQDGWRHITEIRAVA